MDIEIIPAIDLIGGECVRLEQGDYARKKSYSADPVEVAKRYEAVGVRRLHVVDLDGAKAAAPQNLAVLERLAKTSLEIQYGGGIKNEEALERVFACGARRAVCGSIAVTRPEQFEGWLRKYGPERIILGADTKGGRVAINGWEESSETDVESIIARFRPAGLSQVLCTDISKDGMLEGPAFGLYEKLYALFPDLDITVSGGIRGLDDIRRADALGFRSAVVGKAIYENRMTLNELESCLRNE